MTNSELLQLAQIKLTQTLLSIKISLFSVHFKFRSIKSNFSWNIGLPKTFIVTWRETIVFKFNFSSNLAWYTKIKNHSHIDSSQIILPWIIAISTLEMTVWSKTVFDGELKLTFVSSFVESLLLGVLFSETWVLL